MVATAEMILERRAGHFDPSTFRDRYQEALRELIDAKIRGLPVKAKPVETPSPVVDLMGQIFGEHVTGLTAIHNVRRAAGYRSAHSDDVHEWCAVGFAAEAH